jgi:hypothetical protein
MATWLSFKTPYISQTIARYCWIMCCPCWGPTWLTSSFSTGGQGEKNHKWVLNRYWKLQPKMEIASLAPIQCVVIENWICFYFMQRKVLIDSLFCNLFHFNLSFWHASANRLLCPFPSSRRWWTSGWRIFFQYLDRYYVKYLSSDFRSCRGTFEKPKSSYVLSGTLYSYTPVVICWFFLWIGEHFKAGIRCG